MNEKQFNFQFTQNDTANIRTKINHDLNKIISFIKKEFPKVTIGLWGSFSYGEGKVIIIKNKIYYKSDFDMVIITRNLVEYFKVLYNKKIKLIEKELRLKISIIITTNFRIKKKDTAIRIEQILSGDQKQKQFVNNNTNYNWLATSCLNKACYLILKALISKNEKEKNDLFRKGYTSLFYSYVLTKEKYEKVFCLKSNLKKLKQYKKELTKEQLKIIKDSINSRLYNSNKEFKMKEFLFIKPLILELIKKHNKQKNSFYKKRNLKFVYFRLRNFKVPNIFINNTKYNFEILYYLFKAFNKDEIENKFIEKAENKLYKLSFKKNYETNSKKRMIWIYNNLLGYYFYRGIKKM